MPELRRCALLALMLTLVAAPAMADELFRDPMRPYTARTAYQSGPTRLKVNAIIVSDERRLAIVNGRRVGLGDTIGGATVTAISKQELTLDIGGKQKTLRLGHGGSDQ